jgi:hypothetical protein
MEPGEDITSLELSLRLKELSFPQTTTLCYAYHNHSEAYISTTLAPVHPDEVILCSAYTQSDLRPYLPDNIPIRGKLYLLDIPKTTGDDFYIGYREKDSDIILFRFDGFSADTYALLIIRLIEEGKIASPILETTKT